MRDGYAQHLGFGLNAVFQHYYTGTNGVLRRSVNL